MRWPYLGLLVAVSMACGTETFVAAPAPDAASSDATSDASPTDAALDGSVPTTDAATEAGAAGCSFGKGRPMVMVTAGGTPFCIDATEVTEADFAAFTNASPNPWVPNDAGLCTGNPTSADFSASPLVTAPALSGGHPVGVAWCAARAYCAWAGKRLCRSAIVGSVEVGEFWIACSGNGVKSFGYGNAVDASACNGGEGFYAAGSVPSCTAGTPGIFDINGNRLEWIDGFGVDDVVPNVFRDVRGLGGTANCSTLHGVGHWETSIGFRCCADPQ